MKMMEHDHKCKNLFDITVINDYDTKDIDNSLLMMIGTTQSAVCSSPPVFLARVILGTGIHILVDTGTTHNIIDINVA
jgi:ornithine carbamoyltransferase